MNLIIDGNAIGYAHHNATVLTVGGMQTQAVFGFVRSMRMLAQVHRPQDFLVLWDGRAQWRFDMYPAYKGTRKPKDAAGVARKEHYKKQSVLIRAAVRALGLKQMMHPGAEADDLAGLLARQIRAVQGQAVFVTGDQDWLQFLAPGIVWFDPVRNQTVNMATFFNFTGYQTPEEFLNGKALVGDSSDNITPAGGIGKDTAPLFIAKHRSVEEFWRRCDAGEHVPEDKAEMRLWKGVSPYSKEEWEKQFVLPAGLLDNDKDVVKAKKKHMDLWVGDTRNKFLRNMKLMNLLQVPKPENIHSYIEPRAYNEAVFRTLCEKLAFRSILADFDNFVNPFRIALKKAA